MKIVCFSDTHHRDLGNFALPAANLAVFAGDGCAQGTRDDFESFLRWFANQPVRHRVMTPGNHDVWVEKYLQEARALAQQAGVFMLIDEEIELGGLRIWGTPYQPFFCDWAFNIRFRPDLDQHFELIPDGLDILITHCPPQGILDGVKRTVWNAHAGAGETIVEHVGAPGLRRVVERTRPRLHVFGHVHQGYGELQEYGVHFVNACICDEEYREGNRPFVIEMTHGPTPDSERENAD